VEDKPLTKLCRAWLEKNPEFKMPSGSPTMGPSGGPSSYFDVGRVVGHVVETVDDNATGLPIESVENTNSAGSSAGNSTTYSITYRIAPQDDTFLEQWRPSEPLGQKDKLKIDADEEGVPTKVIMMKFGLGGVFEDVENLLDDDGADEVDVDGQATSSTLELTSAKLHLYSMTDTSFGGYISQIPSDWNEENAVWNDYIEDGKGKDKDTNDAVELFLPHDNVDADGNDDKLLGELGVIVSDTWYETDLTSALVNMFNANASTVVLALQIATDSSDGVIYASKENPNEKEPFLELQFVVVTTTTAAATDTSVENATLAAGIESIPTRLPSKSPTFAPLVPTPVMVRPFKPSESSGMDEMTPIITNANLTEIETEGEEITDEEITDEETVVTTSTSVVSSSFQMTITAIETTRRSTRNLLLLRANPKDTRNLDDASHPSIEEKERPAITEHLTRVYAEVLSIAPTSISLVFEGDLVVEDIGNSGENFGGVVRKSVFRVIAIFDDPNISTIQSEDAANVLDQATLYAFVFPEDEQYIEVFKSTGERIVEDPAEYDVTVLKVNYSVGGDDEDELQGASANMDDAANANDGEEDDLSSSESTWLQPTLIIAGASVLVFASSAAALLLWKQRHTEDPAGARKKPGDSPRSLTDATVPSTPSPTVFMERFKTKKKKFDYAEFEDDVDAEDPSSTGSPCDAAISPLSDKDFAARTAPTKTTRSSVNHQPANDIKFSHLQNVSFDDSSVSDVSAHLLGAKGSLKKVDPNASQAESLLLDTTMESYNMEAMSALDQVRFEDVLKASPTQKKYHAGGIEMVTSEDSRDNDDGSLSTGAVPSELYSNLSIDSSVLHYSQVDTSGATYGGHLFTLDMLRNKDSSLLEMPPPPSDAASDSSSQQDVGEDVDNIIPASSSGIEHAPMREKNEQEAVSQCINDELTKVMELLKSPENLTGQAAEAGRSMDESVVHIGNVNGSPAVSATMENDEDGLSGPTPTTADPYDGLSVLMDEESSTDAESDLNDPLKEMNNALSDCMDILEKARLQGRDLSNDPYAEKDAAAENYGEEEDELSLVSEKLD